MPMPDHRLAALPLCLLSLLLTACADDRLSADLEVGVAADGSLQELAIPIDGLQLRRDDGESVSFNYDDSDLIDLLDYTGGRSYALISDEKLDSGNYTGVRLRLGDQDDAYLIEEDGGEFPVVYSSDSDYAELDLDIEGNDSSTVLDNGGENYAIIIVLDLRLSLAEENDQYRLLPALRAVRTEDAASVSGSVDADQVEDSDCRDGRELAEGVAIYAFEGEDIEPDDRDGTGIEPFASAAVEADGSGGYDYQLDNLPAGAYTLALTCRGDEEDAAGNDDLAFSETRQIDLDAEESATRDF